MVQNIVIRKPELQYAHPGLFFPVDMQANNIGAHFFGKKSGESDEAAGLRSGYNRAKGASNGTVDRRWVGGLPTFFANYARFREDTPLLTNLADFGSGGGCCFIVARTLDTNVGATSSDRGHIIGSNGGNTSFGFSLEFAAYSTGQARAIDYRLDTGGAITNTVVTASNDLGKWRIWYVETGRVSSSDKLLAAVNLTGDGSTPDPTDATLVTGRKTGTQTISIGGRINSGGAAYTGSILKDISFALTFNALPSSGQRAALTSQCQAICQLIGITLGSV